MHGFAVLFIVVGVAMVVMLSVGVVVAMRDRRWFAAHGVAVRGEVVSVRRRTSTNTATDAQGFTNTRTTTRYVATVRFTTPDGQTVEAETPASTRARRDGDVLDLRYDPANPQRVRIF